MVAAAASSLSAVIHRVINGRNDPMNDTSSSDSDIGTEEVAFDTCQILANYPMAGENDHETDEEEDDQEDEEEEGNNKRNRLSTDEEENEHSKRVAASEGPEEMTGLMKESVGIGSVEENEDGEENDKEKKVEEEDKETYNIFMREKISRLPLPSILLRYLNYGRDL